MTSKITAFDRPAYFRDEMVAGPFASFAHDHHFESQSNNTVMTDVVSFQSPLGICGRAVDAVFMTRYMHRLIAGRCTAIKLQAESHDPLPNPVDPS